MNKQYKKTMCSVHLKFCLKQKMHFLFVFDTFCFIIQISLNFRLKKMRINIYIIACKLYLELKVRHFISNILETF